MGSLGDGRDWGWTEGGDVLSLTMEESDIIYAHNFHGSFHGLRTSW